MIKIFGISMNVRFKNDLDFVFGLLFGVSSIDRDQGKFSGRKH